MSGAFRECREGDADEEVPIFMGMQAGEKTGSGVREGAAQIHRRRILYMEIFIC